MKKNLKTAFSLMVAALMIVGMVPSAMAAVNKGLTADSTALFGTANFAEGYNAGILTDDYYYVSYDTGSYKGVVLKDNLSKVAAFTAADSGIVWTWNNPVSVKRIDLWILDVGGVGDFEIQTSEDSSWNSPVTVASGNLDHYTGTTVLNEEAPALASYYPIVLQKEVRNVKNLRFVIKSFADSNNKAYISQAMVYDTNDINLGEHKLLSQSKTANGHSPYLRGYALSTTEKETVNSSNGSIYTAQADGTMWPYWSSGDVINLTPFAVADNYPDATKDKIDGNMWYGTSSYLSKIVINKIRLNVNTGNILEFKIWSTTGGGTEKSTNDPKYICRANKLQNVPLNQGKDWKEIATVTCDITKNSTIDERTFYIPQAEPSAHFFIQITKYGLDKTPSIGSIDMYSVADYELPPYIDNVTLVESEGKVTFSAYSFNNNIPNAKVFFAFYSDELLKSVAVKDFALSENRDYSVPCEVPELTGTVTVRAFLLDAGTLVPLLPAPVDPTSAN